MEFSLGIQVILGQSVAAFVVSWAGGSDPSLRKGLRDSHDNGGARGTLELFERAEEPAAGAGSLLEAGSRGLAFFVVLPAAGMPPFLHEPSRQSH